MFDQIFYGLGGAMPDQAKAALLEKHYLKRLPSVSHHFIGWKDGKISAVVTFGVPASRHLQKSICPSDPNMVLELNRLWVHDDMPKNAASAFLSVALKRLPGRIIVSYADTTVGHAGYVYRASNFFYAGWTDMERKTPRFDYMPANGKHSRDAFRSGEFTRVRRKPKVKYWTVSGTPSQRRSAAKIATWPKLDWRELPPPRGE